MSEKIRPGRDIVLRTAANHSVMKAILVAIFLAVSIHAPMAAELLMFEHSGCPWCHKWNREIGAVYAQTEEGKAAPLRRIPISSALPAGIRFFAPVNATPTFVLVDRGAEIGRITGYSNEEAFWGLLGELLKKQSSTDSPEKQKN